MQAGITKRNSLKGELGGQVTPHSPFIRRACCLARGGRFLCGDTQHGRRRAERLRRGLFHVERTRAVFCKMTIELPPYYDSALCDSGTVRLLRRIDQEKITALVDGGEIKWAFDVSTRPRGKVWAVRRELRMWFPEVVTPQMVARLSLNEVIERILPPSRNFFRGFEVAGTLLISRPQLRLIAREMGGKLRNRSFQVTRNEFAGWLKSRWVGGGR